MTKAFSLKDRPLRQQLLWLLMTACSLTIALLFSLVFLSGRAWLQADFANTYAHIAHVAAADAIQAVIKHDTPAARAVLSPIGYHPDASLACLYGANNLLIAATGYPITQTSSQDCPEPPGNTRQILSENALHTFHQIMIKDTVVGTLYLKAKRDTLQTRIAHLALALIGLYLLLLAALYGISTQVQRIITQPLHELGLSLKTTLKERNFKKQVQLSRGDEFGQLSKRFQQLLNLAAQYDNELNTLAHKDMVTGLPNRRMLMHYLEKATNKLQRSGDPLAILMIHIHGLAAFNQRLSHADGDAALKAAAERIQSCARSDDLIARLGGNTFIALMLTAPEVWGIRAAAERIAQAIEEPMFLKDEPLDLTAHIGIAVAPHDGQNPIALLKMAERATQAARSGKGTLFFYNRSLQGDTLATKDSAVELKCLLESERLCLYADPIFQLDRLNIRGIELALFNRMTDDAAKSVQHLLAHCENKELLQHLNNWLAQTLALNLQSLGSAIFSKLEFITWQVTPKQIFCGNFVAAALNMANTINDYGMGLIIAVSEQDIPQLTDSKLQVNEHFKTADIGFAINTHGAGTSILGRLPNLPIRQIRFCCQQQDARASVRSDAEMHDYLNQVIIELANLIDLECVARNITRKAQVKQFNQMSCEFGQGDYFSDQIPLADLQTLLLHAMPLGTSNNASYR